MSIKDEELLHILTNLTGDVDVSRFCYSLTYVAHTLDDLIDKDVVRSDDDVIQAFEVALFHIPTNKFYMKYSYQLLPMMIRMMSNWRIANALEKQSDADHKLMALKLRSDLIYTIIYCVNLAVGYDKALEIANILCEGVDQERIDHMKEVL